MALLSLPLARTLVARFAGACALGAVFLASGCGSWHEESDSLDSMPLIERSETSCPFFGTIAAYGADLISAERNAKLSYKETLKRYRTHFQLVLRYAGDNFNRIDTERFLAVIDLYFCP